MGTAHDFDKAAVIKRALEHPCPNCDAKAGVRCRILTPSSSGGRTRVDVLRNLHPERVTLAWREMLAEEED